MKKFLLISLTLFVVAALTVVTLFWYISSRYYSEHARDTFESAVQKEESHDPVAPSEGEVSGEDQGSPFEIPEAGVPLSSLPLNDAHKAALKGVGIDVSTFILTKAMLTCGEGKIGAERIADIAAGSAPTLPEMTRLLPCLTAN